MMFTLTHCTINRIHHNGFTTTGSPQREKPKITHPVSFRYVY